MERVAPRPPCRLRAPSARATLLLCLLLPLACRGPGLVQAPPAPRETRLPTFAGRAEDWRAVENGIFVRPVDLQAYREGRVAAGHGLLSKDATLPWGVPAEAGFRVRKAHVDLRTNANWQDAVLIAGLAERHIKLLFAEVGAELDLHFPKAPLDVVVHATREDYRGALALALPGHHGWGAWYDDRTRTVHACLQPAPTGALPFQADLRHELTHQVLDGSTPRLGRARIPEGRGLWLWEGFAVWTETLGDETATDTRAPRRERFLKRVGRREVTPLARLVRLSQGEFQGRHYDQCGILLDHLMGARVPQGRDAVLETLADVLHGRWEGDPFPSRVGMGYAALERQWLNGLAAGR